MLKENPSLLDVRNYAKACKRKLKRRGAKLKLINAVKETEKNVFYVVRTMTGIVPFNFHGRTSYLVESGTPAIAEKTKSGYRIYLIGGRNVKSVKELNKLVSSKIIPKPVIARKHELNVMQSVCLA